MQLWEVDGRRAVLQPQMRRWSRSIHTHPDLETQQSTCFLRVCLMHFCMEFYANGFDFYSIIISTFVWLITQTPVSNDAFLSLGYFRVLHFMYYTFDF